MDDRTAARPNAKTPVFIVAIPQLRNYHAAAGAAHGSRRPCSVRGAIYTISDLARLKCSTTEIAHKSDGIRNANQDVPSFE